MEQLGLESVLKSGLKINASVGVVVQWVKLILGMSASPGSNSASKLDTVSC